jgi:hypothetical protein
LRRKVAHREALGQSAAGATATRDFSPIDRLFPHDSFHVGGFQSAIALENALL